MDYSKLRNQTFESGQEEEAVTVNTRALIDKVLARYSGEWTTLRELIQNAADANATKVAIKFETSPSASVPLPQSNDEAALLKHTILNHHLQRLVVTNNGTPFTENDWARLKRIAEGNPDETKIGAFGVGFYSVFSECENPLVSSGDQSMAFFWKGNSLFTRRGAVPDAMRTGETSFVLDHREPNSPVPNLMSICQFLSSSLTFVGLETLELWVDKWNVFTLRKKSAPSTSVDIPRHIGTRTLDGLMKVKGVSSQNAQIDASWTNIVGWTPTREPTAQAEPEQKSTSLRSFFSRLTANPNSAAKKAAKEEEAIQQAISDDISGTSSATVFIRVSTVSIATSVPKSYADELERATKKPPPKTTRIAILTSSHDETEATLSTLTGTASQKVAQVVLSALPTKNGRVYIGFPTAQTTGVLAHVSAPSLIPTVERENIDLNARYVRTWNEELLRAAGIACRIAYSGEMGSIRDRLAASARANNGVIQESDIEKALPAAIHVLKQFTFRDSTPLLKVGALVEEAFWTCSVQKSSIELLSSVGVLSSDQVRVATEKLSFVKGLAVVPDLIMTEAKDFMKKLTDYGFIFEIQIADIKNELEKQTLSEEQLEEFLKWLAPKAFSVEIDKAAVKSLFSAAIVTLNPDQVKYGQPGILYLRKIQNFVNVSRISPTAPIPSDTIPFRFTRNISGPELHAMTWQELQIVPWLRWLIESAVANRIPAEISMLQSPDFAAQALGIVSKAWEQLSGSSKGTVIELLSQNPVMPTRVGMRKPPDSYFTSVQLFDDLPTIQRLDGVKEKFLKALGVRKTIELSVIFERLMRADSTTDSKYSTWNHVDLIRYLVSVWNDIPDSDIAQLRGKSICPAEVAGDSRQGTKERYPLSKLYEPTDALRALKLPVLQWPGQWNAYSSEGKFLKLLGLRLHPSTPELIEIIANAHATLDIATYEAGLRYFLDNHHQHGYGSFDLANVALAFVPVASTEKRKVARPSECFADPDASVLGFPILREDLQQHASKLGVLVNPPIQECALRLLRSPPVDEAAAKLLFDYFAKRLADITGNIADRLGTACIVPITKRNETSGKSATRHTTPRACFLGDDDEYGDIFDYVDFGRKANTFLMRCGCKEEPSTVELTRTLIREPARIFSTLQVEKYLGLLRKLHVNMPVLKKDRDLWKEMKRQPFLLAYYEKPAEKKAEKSAAPLNLMDDLDDPDSEPMVREWWMRSADQIVVIDDLISYTLFKQHLVAAPQDENLEDLYLALGAQYVSERVEEEPRLGPRIGDQHKAVQLRSLVMERARLFLHEQAPGTISHDVKWLEKNLDVQVVQSVSLRRQLKGDRHTHTEKRSAAIAPSSTSRGKYVLSITSDYEAWQVSQEVVSLLVARPKTQTIMIFEMFMTTSLYRLRARGYNVDRVLKRKQAEEARSAEVDRQRRKEEEKQRAEEAAAQKEKEALVVPHTTQGGDEYHDSDEGQRSSMDKTALMPGSFNDTPQRPRANSNRRSRNFFSNITRQLGLGNHGAAGGGGNDALGTVRNLLGAGSGPGTGRAADWPLNTGPPEPPPYTPYDSNTLQKQGTRTRASEPVTSQTNVQSNLMKAVGASRSYDSSQLFSPPSTVNVKESPSYCDAKPGHDLKFIYQTSDKVKVYFDKELAGSGSDTDAFVQRHNGAIELFGGLILSAASVFSMSPSTLHIFYNDSGSTIAFNSGGSIFCNYRFFQQLHLAGMTEAADATKQVQAQVAALVYWWVVLCHELAHNLVQDHSSDHSYYTEQFVVQYFPVVLQHIIGGGKLSMPANGGAGEGSSRQLTGVERAFS